MNDKERAKLIDFFKSDRQEYVELVFSLLESLSKQLEFKLKIQSASIQLIHKFPFAVVGFRKSKSYFFIEFYYNSVIDSHCIVKTTRLSNSVIIHTVNLSSESTIDDNIFDWIKSSYDLTMKNNAD